ncbi:MAG TPA: hypothetical protein VIY96_07735, partial [Thermoanaerobaculia bacterium]
VVVTNRASTCSATAPGFQPQVLCDAATPTPTITPVFTSTPTPTRTPTPIPGADLFATKADAPDPVVMGNNVTYTIIAGNNGPGTATGMMVTDPIPNGTTFVSCTISLGSCSGPGVGVNGTVTGNIGTLGPGGSVTMTVVVNVTTALGGTTISNTATASSSSPDPNGVNNNGTATTTVNP